MSSLVDLPCLKKISPKAPKKVSKSSSSSTTRRPRTSPIWAYATQDPNERITLNKDGQEVWICSLCTSKTTSYLLSGGTAAPIRHLLRIHHIQIPPSNSKNKRKSKSCLKSSIANQLAISNQHSISNQHHISSSQLSSSSSASNQPSISSNPPKQLLPSPAIKSNPSNQQDSLSKTIAASMNNNSSNITNLATLNLNNYPIQDPSSNSALFDVLLKYDVPASAIPTPKFRAFCSIVNPDAVLAINSSDNHHNTNDSLPSSSSSINLDSLPSTSPSLSPTCPSSTSQTPYSLSKYIDSSYLTAPATPISSESIIINPASSQFIFPHNTPQYTYFSPITPSTTSSSSSISSPESTFSPPQNIPLQTTTIISNPNASSDDGWYYPGLDSPITPISSTSVTSSSSSTSNNNPSSTSYFPFSPMTIPNIQYSNISCPNLYDQSGNILIENPSQLVPFEKPMPIYQPSNYDVNFFTLVEW